MNPRRHGLCIHDECTALLLTPDRLGLRFSKTLQMRFRLFALLSATSLLTFPVFGNATLVYQNISSNTGALSQSVLDTTTNLQWLSPVATKRQSIASVSGGYDGWTSDGFRYATLAELRALMSNAGIPITAASSLARWYDPLAISAMQEIILGLGWTYQNNPPSPENPFGQREIFGIVSDHYLGDGHTTPSHRYALLGASDNVAYADTVGRQWLYESQDSLVGSFLVREQLSIPEPSSLALLISGLLLCLVNRRSAKPPSAHGSA